MDEKTVHKETSKRNKTEKRKGARYYESKVLYNRKFTTPLKKKRKNEYDAEEEAKLENIVFGDPNDIIDNLLNDKSETKEGDESVDISEEVDANEDNKSTRKEDSENDDENEVKSDEDISVLSQSSDARPEEKKAAWIDKDDYEYT
ncbi:hypothetical protein PUN28_017613 [Cardiocondyla obscurior]